MAFRKFIFFPSFQEAKSAQEYDHMYQKVVGLATITGIDLEVVRNENLHHLNEGKFLIEDYITENNISVSDETIYRQQLQHWKNTTAWSDYYKLGNEYCYLKDHSDVSYPDIREIDPETLTRIDNNGLPFGETANIQ